MVAGYELSTSSRQSDLKLCGMINNFFNLSVVQNININFENINFSTNPTSGG